MKKCKITIDGMKLTDILTAIANRLANLECPTRPPNNAVRVHGVFGGVISSPPLPDRAIIDVYGTECHVPMADFEFTDPTIQNIWTTSNQGTSDREL